MSLIKASWKSVGNSISNISIGTIKQSRWPKSRVSSSRSRWCRAMSYWRISTRIMRVRRFLILLLITSYSYAMNKRSLTSNWRHIHLKRWCKQQQAWQNKDKSRQLASKKNINNQDKAKVNWNLLITKKKLDASKHKLAKQRNRKVVVNSSKKVK